MSWTLEAGHPKICPRTMWNRLRILPVPGRRCGFLDLLLPSDRLQTPLSWHPGQKMVTWSNISRFILPGGYLLSGRHQKEISMNSGVKFGFSVLVLLPCRLNRSKTSLLACMFQEFVDLYRLGRLIVKFLLWPPSNGFAVVVFVVYKEKNINFNLFYM